MANLDPIVLEIVGKDKTKEAFDSASKSVKDNKKYVDDLIKSLKRQQAEIGMSTKDLKLNELANKGVGIAVQKQVATLYDQIEATKKSTAASGKLKQQLRFVRGGFGQVGHQIQDVVVQAQMGTNAFLILGQQGSQIASLFGPGGAMIGALVAVGAAFATYIVASNKAEEVTKDFKDEARSLAGELSSLSGAMRDAASAKVEKNFNDILVTTLDLRQKLRLAEAAAKSLGSGMNLGALSADDLTYKIAQLRGEIDANEKLLQLLGARLDGTSSSTEDLLKSLEDEVALFGASARAIAIHTATMEGATQADIDRINALYDQLEAMQAIEAQEKAASKKKHAKVGDNFSDQFNREAAIFDDLAALEKGFMTEQELLMDNEMAKLAIIQDALDKKIISEQYAADLTKQIHQETADATRAATLTQASAVVGAMQAQVGQLAGLFDEASGIGKAFFVLQQAMGAAQAIISGHVAQMNIVRNATALGLDPATAAALGSVALAMGYASAGAIMGQTVASFEGGGITFNGARSGGLDGKGGRMAMVHPNEKITDLEKGGGSGQPVNISFNISAVDAKGVDQLLVERRSLITNLVNKAINNRGRSSLA